jgi:hypothetical protein
MPVPKTISLSLPKAALDFRSRIWDQSFRTFAGGPPLLRYAHCARAAGVRIAGVGHHAAGTGRGVWQKTLRTLALRKSFLYRKEP